jgi:hypothetical protein
MGMGAKYGDDESLMGRAVSQILQWANPTTST